MKKSSMMGTTTTTFLFVLLFISSSLNAQFKMVGYLTNWGNLATDAGSVDYSKITHINIAFINPNGSGTLSPTTSLSTAVQIIHDNNAKVLASLGGAGSPASWTTLMEPANRAAFITKIVDFSKTYNLDGIDMDLEGSAIDGNYNDFIVALSTALKAEGKLLTAAVATWNGWDIEDKALAAFDFVNVMSYDQFGTWSGPGQHSAYSAAVNDLQYWAVTRGLAKSKLVLGLPNYGYRWETSGNSSMTIKQIVNAYPRAIDQDSITTATGGDIYYNGIPTIKQKTSLAIDKASGVMWWTSQFDFPSSDSRSLIRAMDEVIKAASNNSSPQISLLTPANDTSFTEGDSIIITADANDSDGTISYVSFYAESLKIGQVATAPYTINWNTAAPGTYKIYCKTIDNDYGTSTSDTITIVVNPSKIQLPFGGTAWPIPGKIEAENYDIGDTLAYFDSSVKNDGELYRTGSVDIEACSDNGGGYNVGWTAPLEWMEYTVNVTKDTLYDFMAWVASTASGKTFHIEIDGINIGTVNVPKTGGWQSWQSAKVAGVPLTSGQKVMRIVIEDGDFNLNYINVIYINSSPEELAEPSIADNTAIYPNPCHDNFMLNFNSAQEALEICLYDLSGKQVMQKIFPAGERSQIFDMSPFSQGIYTCVIIGNDKVSVLKIVKQ